MKRAIAPRPDYVDTRNDLGKLYVQQGDDPAALQQFDRCRDIEPQFDRAVLNEALVYHRMGRAEDARKLLRDFLRQQPATPVLQKCCNGWVTRDEFCKAAKPACIVVPFRQHGGHGAASQPERTRAYRRTGAGQVHLEAEQLARGVHRAVARRGI